jgi:hypothetical protein
VAGCQDQVSVNATPTKAISPGGKLGRGKHLAPPARSRPTSRANTTKSPSPSPTAARSRCTSTVRSTSSRAAHTARPAATARRRPRPRRSAGSSDLQQPANVRRTPGPHPVRSPPRHHRWVAMPALWSATAAAQALSSARALSKRDERRPGGMSRRRMRVYEAIPKRSPKLSTLQRSACPIQIRDFGSR